MIHHIFGGRFRRVGPIAAVLLATLLVPGAVLADTTGGAPPIQPASSRDATISVSTSVKLTARVVAEVDVDVVCQPFDSYDWQTGSTYQTTEGSVEYGNVVLEQAAGRSVAWGQADVTGLATCDGSTVNHYEAFLTPSATLFKPGAAVVGAVIYIADKASYQDSDYASSGVVEVKITK
jgi:hypothetical protein